MRLLIGSRLFVRGTRFFSYSNISDTYPDSCISILKAFLIYKISILLIKLAKQSSCLSSDGIGRVIGNTTWVTSHSNSYVSRFSPGSSPAVLDDPIAIRFVANGEYSVVQPVGGSAAQDTTWVELEWAGINSYSNWSTIQHKFKHTFTRFRRVTVTDMVGSLTAIEKIGNGFIGIVLAGTFSAVVWIIGLSLNATLSNDVIPSPIIPSTLASLAASVTIE